MKFDAHLINEIMKHMPAWAENYPMKGACGGFTLRVNWKLRNDPARPNKYSKTIAIALPRELTEDFQHFTEPMQRTALTKIGGIVSSQLRGFNPDHDSPRGVLEPVEYWVIPHESLFG